MQSNLGLGSSRLPEMSIDDDHYDNFAWRKKAAARKEFEAQMAAQKI